MGRQLRLLRDRSGQSQQQLAAKAGLSIRALRELESGRSNPSLTTVARVASTLRVSLDDLVEWARANASHADWTPAAAEGERPGLLTRELPNPRMRARIIDLSADEDGWPAPPQGPVFGHVLAGSVSVLLDQQQTRLSEGDSFHAQSGALREWRGLHSGARLLVVEAEDVSPVTTMRGEGSA